MEDEAKISFWDALICASALSSGARLILSEDLKSGQVVVGIRIENPFLNGSCGKFDCQMVAIGLLGELQVRHSYTNTQQSPYPVDRLVRLRTPGEPSTLRERTEPPAEAGK